MTLETYRKAHDPNLDMGSLTEPRKGCKQQTKLKDFVWVYHGATVCRECARKYKAKEPKP